MADRNVRTRERDPDPDRDRDPVEVAAPDRSLGELMGELTREFSELARQEVQLARLELKEEATKAGKIGGMFGGAGVAGFVALLMLSFAAAWGIGAAIPVAWGFVIVGVLHATVAGFLFLAARRRAQEMNPVPTETVETLKEGKEWARARRK